MISREQAIEICDQEFPNGLDRIVELCRITVRVCASAEGWGFRPKRGGYVIRVNRDVFRGRRKFTLSHEIAHMILHTDHHAATGSGVVGDLLSDIPEEREANRLAGELLLPEAIVRKWLAGVVVDSQAIRSLARAAEASELATAVRVRTLGDSLGLQRACLYMFGCEGKPGRIIGPQSLAADAARSIYDNLCETRLHDQVFPTSLAGTSGAAIRLSNPAEPCLLVHLVDAAMPLRGLEALRRHYHEQHPDFYKRLMATIGSWTGHNRGLMLDESLAGYLAKYDNQESWQTDERYLLFREEDCQQLIRMKIRSQVGGR